MAETAQLQAFGEVRDNPVVLDHSVTEPVCDGLNTALASFQGLYLQYQKHHFVVEGAEFYSLHQFFGDSYEQVQEYVDDLGERLNGLGGVPAASFSSWRNCAVFNRKPMGSMLVGKWWKMT